jgi:hypothetical protein
MAKNMKQYYTGYLNVVHVIIDTYIGITLKTFSRVCIYVYWQYPICSKEFL